MTSTNIILSEFGAGLTLRKETAGWYGGDACPGAKESEASDSWGFLSSLAYMWAVDEDRHTHTHTR